MNAKQYLDEQYYTIGKLTLKDRNNKTEYPASSIQDTELRDYGNKFGMH